MHRRAASYGGWRLGLLLLCLTARASAEAQKGVEAGTDETLDQPLPEQGMSEEDIFADSDLPPIEEDPFSRALLHSSACIDLEVAPWGCCICMYAKKVAFHVQVL